MTEDNAWAALLEVRNLGVSRSARPVWADLSFSMTPGTLLLVTGANGSGKTTLLGTLAGLTEPDEGEIIWSGMPTKNSSAYRRQMAYLAHSNGLNTDTALVDNLVYTAQLAGNIPLPAVRAAVNDALARVGMEKHGHRMLRQLSQGQQRRAALARLLLQRGRLWLLDEPFNALDSDATKQFCQTLSTHLKYGGLAVLCTHQPIDIDAPRASSLQL
jgi:heme exporter protein A